MLFDGNEVANIIISDEVIKALIEGQDRKEDVMKKCVSTIIVIGFVFMSFSVLHAEQKPIVLKFAHFTRDKSVFSEDVRYFVKEVKKRTDGRVDFQIYWSQSLVKAKDAISAVDTGLADVAAITPAYTPDLMPLSSVAAAPFCMKNYYSGHTGFMDLYYDSDYSAFREEFANNNMVLLFSWGGCIIEIISKEPVNNIDSLKGKKVRLQAAPYSPLYTDLGWVPVALSPMETYEALMRGTMDAAGTYPMLSLGYKFIEVAKHHTNNRFGNSGGVFIVINRKVFNKLPKDVHNIMKKVGYEAVKHQADAYEKAETASYEAMAKAGVTLYKWTAEEMAKFESAIPAATEKFLNGLEEKGHPAKATFKRFQQHQEKYLK
jgi:TRAP-type C4-dicarboxylate transport system substrate-binding protein